MDGNNIILKDKIIIEHKYDGSSKFEFWTSLEKDDVLEISLPLLKTGRGASGIYSPVITVLNLTQNKIYTDAFNKIQVYLNKIKFRKFNYF